MSSAIKIFATIFGVLFLLGVFVPYFNTMFSEDSTTNVDTSVFDGNSYLSILLNIVTCMFWTFGLNAWINLLILTPLRVILGITIWFIVSPAK